MGKPRKRGAQSARDSDADSARSRSPNTSNRGEEMEEDSDYEDFEDCTTRERLLFTKMEEMKALIVRLKNEKDKEMDEHKKTMIAWGKASQKDENEINKLTKENNEMKTRVTHLEDLMRKHLEKKNEEKDLENEPKKKKPDEKERREKEKEKNRMETGEDQGFELVENKRKRPATIKEIQKEQREEKKAKKQGTEQENGKDNRERRPPPIILRNAAGTWRRIQEGFRSQDIKCKPGTYKPQQGMKLHMETSDDFRKAVRYLDTIKEIQWYSFNVQEDKSRKIVIKGLLETDSAEEVLKALNEEGYSPKRVTQLRSRYGDRRMLPIFLVELDSSEEVKIRKLEYLMDMRVKIEELKKPDTPLQCYRCQGFHHGQSSCRLLEKCVACGGEHRSTECKRPKEEKPTCANCQGEHPANYRGCPKAPKKAAWKPSVAPPPQTKSYAEVAQPAAAATKMMDTIMKTVMEKINQVLEEFARGMAK